MLEEVIQDEIVDESDKFMTNEQKVQVLTSIEADACAVEKLTCFCCDARAMGMVSR